MVQARVFISFAAEDSWARDLFVGQSRHPDTPWEIVDLSLHQPFSERWKTQTRPRIKGCDVVIQLISPSTYKADGVVREVECARQEGIPVFGVWIDKDKKGRFPGCFASSDVIEWTWDGVGRRIDLALRRR